MGRVATAVLALALVALPAQAGDAPGLSVDGLAVHLADGLQRTADGRLWITQADLESGLHVVVRRLIPRPPEPRRPRRKDERDTWILCGRTRCAPYPGTAQGTLAAPAFDLARVARALGYRLRTRRDVLELRTKAPRRTAPHRLTRAGTLVPDLQLTFLDGARRSLRRVAPRRLLLVTWATWSASRERLGDWVTFATRRQARDLVLWFVALDVEGADRVRDYVTAAGDVPVAVDRDAELARFFPLQDAGAWFYVDDLGVLRADGTALDDTARMWIDLHLEEKPAGRPVTEPSAPGPPDLAALRAQVAASPRAVEPRLALLDALGPEQAEEARALTGALLELQPKSVPFAYRAARWALDAGDRPAALAVLDAARRRVPASHLLRRQYRALAEPDRYYKGPIDTAWERAQRLKEDAEFGRPRRR